MADSNGPSDVRDRPIAETDERPLGSDDYLGRKELELAKVELAEKGKKAGVGAGMFGGAGLLGVFAFGALTACIVLALATAIPAWLAALIVAVVYGAIAAVLALRGKTQVRRATPPIPEQAVDSTKEDVEWVKTRAKASRS